jgi:hypothetical protein
MEVVPLAIFSGDGSGQRHRQCGGAWVENRAVDGSAAQMVSGLYGFSMWEQADNLCVIVGRLLAQAKCKMCIVYLDTVFSPNDQMKRRGNLHRGGVGSFNKHITWFTCNYKQRQRE